MWYKDDVFKVRFLEVCAFEVAGDTVGAEEYTVSGLQSRRADVDSGREIFAAYVEDEVVSLRVMPGHLGAGEALIE